MPPQTDSAGGKSFLVDPNSPNPLVPDAIAQFSSQQDTLPQQFVDSPAASPIAIGSTQPSNTNTSSRDLVQNEIAGVGSELSPYIGTEGILHGRSGQAGIR